MRMVFNQSFVVLSEGVTGTDAEEEEDDDDESSGEPDIMSCITEA